MLTAIELESFKCFRKLVLPLAQCTLLTGKNASGKSTVMQALLLLQQTATDMDELQPTQQNRELRLNGSLVNLGSAADVIDKVTGHRECAIALATEDGRCQWNFSIRDRRAITIPVQSIDWLPTGGKAKHFRATDQKDVLGPTLIPHSWTSSDEHGDIADLERALQTIQYISAERIGPRETYPLIERQRRYVGALGQNAPALLYSFADERIARALVAPAAPPTLRNQVQAWMREFFPGCGIDVQPVPNANLVALGIRTSDETDYHRPQHVGFGLTHILPIITAALIIKERQLLLIENPEVHLHPAGQSWMGQFLARVAATGVQVVVETHSDHVLNGVRRAVRTERLDAADVAVHFFSERPPGDADKMSQVVSPVINQAGNFDHWPDGFFDQFDKDMDFFADWGD